ANADKQVTRGGIMEHHHCASGGSHRPDREHTKGPVECIVTPLPVRDADGRRGADSERIAELHRQVRDGVYDNIGTIDAVARRILQSGDL
ncbi:MAG: hypothetical protein ACJ8AD_10295, partial [Gemmatimonadaceae bacterium]